MGFFLAVMADKFALKVIIFLQAVVIVRFKKCVFQKKKKKGEKSLNRAASVYRYPGALTVTLLNYCSNLTFKVKYLFLSNFFNPILLSQNTN